MNALRLPVLGLLVATALAQGNPDRFVPQSAQFVMRIAGPAKWRAEFKGTKVAELLAGKTLAPMMQQLEQAMSGGPEAAEAGMDPELMAAMWNDYRGDIVVALRLDIDDVMLALEDNRPPSMAVSIAFGPDESFDLPALATALTDLVERKSGDELRDITVGDHVLRCKVESDATMSSPTMIDGHMVMVIATDMERDAPAMLATDNRRAASGAGKPFYLHVDTKAALKTLMGLVADRVDADPNAPPIDVVQLMTDFGLGCIEGVDMSISADGDQAVVETNIATTSENRGMLAMLCLDQGPPKLLRYLPESADTFSVQAFDFGAVYQTVAKIWAGVEDVVPMTFQEVESSFEEATKVRLRQDLIDHVGTELLSLSDFTAAADLEPDDMSAMFAGSCYGLALRNGKAFGEALETALRSRGMHAARKSEDYQGVTVYRFKIAGAVEIEYAVTDDLLLVAPGSDDSSRAQLRSVLDARAKPRTDLPKILARQQNSVPAGWNGVGVTPMATLMTYLGTAMKDAPVDMPPEVGMVFEMMGALGDEMKQIGLNEAIGFSYASARGFRSIVRF